MIFNRSDEINLRGFQFPFFILRQKIDSRGPKALTSATARKSNSKPKAIADTWKIG